MGFVLAVAVAGGACGPASASAPPSAVGAAIQSPAAGLSPKPSSSVPTSTPAPLPTPRPVSPTRQAVERLTAAVAANPADADAQRDLGLALTQLIRETLDPTLYVPAEDALRASDGLQPDDARPLVGLGGLQLGKHRFADALVTGKRAVLLAPTLAAAHGVVVDSLVELGRYPEADAAAARMFAVGDDLGTYARVSYLKELHGDLDAARAAMAGAAVQPGLAPENQAFALSLLANLERWTGDPDGARATWERAMTLVPEHPPSLAGLGRLAVAAGDLAEAARLFGRAADVIPLPEYVIALGEIQAASGDDKAAKASFALAGAEIHLFQANGVTVDLDLALFEADHGDPTRALGLAKAAYAETPTVRAADAVAWALHRLGRDEQAVTWSVKALRLGSRDPLLRYHAGAIAAAAGDARAARHDLSLALATDPGFSATGAAEATRLLAALGS